MRTNALHGWRRLLSIRKQSRLLTSIITGFIVGYLVLAFELFYHGLRFIAKFPGLGAALTERLMFTLFAFLFALLLLSNLVIAYTNLFRNRETAFLLTLPIPAQTIFNWKFMETVIIASWAFLFLIAPLLVAFGLVREVAWHFYPLTALLVALFIILPGVLGASLAIAIGRHLDRKSFQLMLVLLAVVLLAVVAFWWKSNAVDDDLLDRRTLEALDQLLARTRFTMFPFLPSYWLSSAVLQWAEGVFRGALFFAGVLLSHTLFFGSVAFTRFGRVFYVWPPRCKADRAAAFIYCGRRASSIPADRACSNDWAPGWFSWRRKPGRWPSRISACSGAIPRNGGNRWCFSACWARISLICATSPTSFPARFGFTRWPF